VTVRVIGTAMAGMAPQTVSLAETRALGDQVPGGANVDKASNMITFTGSSTHAIGRRQAFQTSAGLRPTSTRAAAKNGS
jgi:hypothetical protein